MDVMLNPEAWSIDAYESGGLTFPKGEVVSVDAKAFETLKDETLNHFGKEVPAVVQIGATAKGGEVDADKAAKQQV